MDILLFKCVCNEELTVTVLIHIVLCNKCYLAIKKSEKLLVNTEVQRVLCTRTDANWQV